MKRWTFLMLLISQIGFGQGLFESAGEESSKSLNYELNGYVRGAYFLGKSLKKESEIATQSAYGETAMKLKIKKIGFGEAFSDLRFSSGYAYNEKYTRLDVREAYLKYYIDNLNFSIGKQIVVWGRADGYNPTDMLSLQDFLARSANEDDRRFGNWLLSTSYRLGILHFEAVWVPTYESWKIPFDIFGEKFSIPFQTPNFPDLSIKNSAYALKISLFGSKIDGSVSYFSGYSPKPGINGNIQESTPTLYTEAYKVNMFGADFQTNIGKIGFRGEFAYTQTLEKKDFPYLPKPDFQWVVGADRTWGNFMVNLQYVGRWVFDFEPLQKPQDASKLFNYILEEQNRMFSSQQHQMAHSFSLRLSQKFFRETLDFNIFGMYNFSTEEVLLRPKISYFISDAMELSAGMEYFSGPDNTLYGWIDEIVNAGFIELKILF